MKLKIKIKQKIKNDDDPKKFYDDLLSESSESDLDNKTTDLRSFEELWIPLYRNVGTSLIYG